MAKKNELLIIVVIGGVLIVWFLFGIASYFLFNDWSSRGTFGDMFGVVNSLFSGLAFAILILTAHMQRQELELQRKELKDTRKEFNEQNKTMKLQRFENTFFKMLSLYNDIVNNLHTSRSGGISSKRDVFKSVVNLVASKLTSENSSNPNHVQDTIANAFKEIDIRQYFKHVVKMIEFVDNSDLDQNLFYINLIKAQFSDYELVSILYFLNTDERDKNNIKVLSKYGFFDNLNKDSVHKKYRELDEYNQLLLMQNFNTT